MHEKLLIADTEILKSNYIDALYYSGAIKIAANAESRFELRNGGRSWIYVDHGDMISSPETNQAFISVLYEMLYRQFPAESSTLVSIPSKSSPQVVGTLAYLGEYRQIGVTSEELAHAEKGTGRRVRIPQDIAETPSLVLVDDVLTSGTTAVQTKQAVTEALGEQAKDFNFHLIVGFARNPDTATPRLLHEGFRSVSWAIEMRHVLLTRWNFLTINQQEGLRTEFPDIINHS